MPICLLDYTNIKINLFANEAKLLKNLRMWLLNRNNDDSSEHKVCTRCLVLLFYNPCKLRLTYLYCQYLFSVESKTTFSFVHCLVNTLFLFIVDVAIIVSVFFCMLNTYRVSLRPQELELKRILCIYFFRDHFVNGILTILDHRPRVSFSRTSR